MNLAEFVGRASDRLTVAMLPRSGTPEAADLVHEQMGVVRRAQFTAIMATSEPMMLANILNAISLIALEHYVGRLSVLTGFWAALVVAFASYGLLSAWRFKAARQRKTAGRRGPGRIVVSSIMLAVIWCYPLVFVLPGASLLQIAFVSALAAGMIAGGALALYPVPLAGILYTLILSAVAYFAIVTNDLLPTLPFAMVTGTFILVVTFSVHRHTAMFLSEIAGKLDAERQRDVVNLLLTTFQGEGGQVLWRTDPRLVLKTDPAPLLELLRLRSRTAGQPSLLSILREADAFQDDNDLERHLVRLSSGQVVESCEFKAELRTGRGLVVKIAGRPISDSGSEEAGFHGYVTDITAETLAKEKVLELATRDPMTGLLNAAEFTKQAAVALRQIDGTAEKALFLFIDADNLKMVNDSLGHAAGDALISTIAQTVSSKFPSSGLVGRKGGDEFVVFVTVPGNTDELSWVAGIARDLNTSFCYKGAEFPMSCSIGVGVAEAAVKSLSSLELEADRALYRAKTQGKGLARIYDDEMGIDVIGDRLLAAELSSALRAHRLQIELQPIVACDTGRVLGAEALVRWHHPTRGWIEPSKIAALAQKERLSQQLLLFVLTQALRRARDWPEDSFVSINISPDDLQHARLATVIADVIRDENVSAGRIWFEITETGLLQNSEEVRANLKALCNLGAKVALDDFGTGYSALSYLSSYPAEIIKIDKSLINGISANASSKVIVNTLVRLADLNGYMLVAEGVEDDAALTMLAGMGVAMAQGFGVYRPMKPGDFEDLLSAQRRPQLPSPELSSAL